MKIDVFKIYGETQSKWIAGSGDSVMHCWREALGSGRRDAHDGREDDVRPAAARARPAHLRRAEEARPPQGVRLALFLSLVLALASASASASRWGSFAAAGSWGSTPRWTSPSASLPEPPAAFRLRLRRAEPTRPAPPHSSSSSLSFASCLLWLFTRTSAPRSSLILISSLTLSATLWHQLRVHSDFCSTVYTPHSNIAFRCLLCHPFIGNHVLFYRFDHVDWMT